MFWNTLQKSVKVIFTPLGRLATGLGVTVGLADIVLESARDYFLAGTAKVVTDLVFQAISHTLKAMTLNLGNLLNIFTEVFNEASEPLCYVWKNRSDFLKFLIDLAEAVRFSKTDDSRYNEWDMTSTNNRYAIVYQLQRLALSFVFFLSNKGSIKLENLEMNTMLNSDFPNGTALPPTVPAKLNKSKERWLFVNGICGEYHWLELSCNKLRDRFKKEITGVFNRSDGIIWDLIECAGERHLENQKTLLQRTKSSMDAQNILEKELINALWPSTKKATHQVVMIAHSQGCLLLRLVLQNILKKYKRKTQRDDIKNRLSIFTFGNPSIDWKVNDGSESLHGYMKRTEHFANREDFVAKLGILNSYNFEERGYLRQHVFISECKGHWFGSQYSLSKDDYHEGRNSTLLNEDYHLN